MVLFKKGKERKEKIYRLVLVLRYLWDSIFKKFNFRLKSNIFNGFLYVYFFMRFFRNEMQ